MVWSTSEIPYASGSTSSWCLRKWVYFLACDIVKERCIAEKRLYGAWFLFMRRYRINWKDIREFQLSKSAITAALDCLLQDKEVDRVYLSGGFSKSIDIEDCIRLGLFSRAWKDKSSISGNTALRGICQYALLQDRKKIEEIQGKSKTISLMENSLFFEYFVDNMYFIEREWLCLSQSMQNIRNTIY